eukprot:c38188_g1_i1 orf=254-448(+)
MNSCKFPSLRTSSCSRVLLAAWCDSLGEQPLSSNHCPPGQVTQAQEVSEISLEEKGPFSLYFSL